jgi:hypothetical protein
MSSKAICNGNGDISTYTEASDSFPGFATCHTTKKEKRLVLAQMTFLTFLEPMLSNISNELRHKLLASYARLNM